jgi:hypothetical protein
MQYYQNEDLISSALVAASVLIAACHNGHVSGCQSLNISFWFFGVLFAQAQLEGFAN